MRHRRQWKGEGEGEGKRCRHKRGLSTSQPGEGGRHDALRVARKRRKDGAAAHSSGTPAHITWYRTHPQKPRHAHGIGPCLLLHLGQKYGEDKSVSNHLHLNPLRCKHALRVGLVVRFGVSGVGSGLRRRLCSGGGHRAAHRLPPDRFPETQRPSQPPLGRYGRPGASAMCALCVGRVRLQPAVGALFRAGQCVWTSVGCSVSKPSTLLSLSGGRLPFMHPVSALRRCFGGRLVSCACACLCLCVCVCVCSYICCVGYSVCVSVSTFLGNPQMRRSLIIRYTVFTSVSVCLCAVVADGTSPRQRWRR